MTRDLPDFLRTLIENAPRAGEGVHNWLFRSARQLHAHLPATEIFRLLGAHVQHCGRHVSDLELWDAIKNSLECAWQPHGKNFSAQLPAKSKWPTANHQQRASIVRENGGLADLWELSGIRLEDSLSHTEEIVDKLFPGNSLLCCAESQSVFDTKPRAEWRGKLSSLQLLVPSPMSEVTGQTRDGRESKHTLANTGPRRFLIVEFDTGTPDEHAALLIHLAEHAPLVCAVHSGGKSLHGWFYCAGQPEEKLLRFFRYAVSLGADSATWTPSQFVRMPDGVRDNSRNQCVYYLNFRPLEVKP